MPDLSLNNVFDKAFEQAGHAASGLACGAREALLNYAMDYASKLGAGDAMGNVNIPGINDPADNFEDSAPNQENEPPAHRCAKESGAAAVSAIISGAANSMQYFDLVRKGDMTPREALGKIIGETVASAADSALKAAGSAGLQIIGERYGSEDNALKALAGQGVEILMEKLPSSGGAALTDGIARALTFAQGETPEAPIPWQIEQALPNGADILSLARKFMGIAEKIFKGKFPPVIKGFPLNPAALVAAAAIAAATNIAVKNCIERPYQDILRNTETLGEAAAELARVAGRMRGAQALFAKCLESDARMETELQCQMARVDQAGQSARDAILNI